MRIPNWPKIPIWDIPERMDLETTYQLLSSLDNPHKKLPPVIHVAGTNGKGSTVAMLGSIFTEAGYKVDSYTSPHLLNFNERINISGNSISDLHLNDVIFRVKKVSDANNLTPTFFEGTTVAAFLAFSESKSDILILETGLGGRIDCTNVVEKPILTIITSISYDHTDYLGDKISQIALEKAGIIKENVPCVVGEQYDEVYDILVEQCEIKSAPNFCYKYDFIVRKEDQDFKYISEKFNISFPLPSLRGDHQILNASSVIASVMLLNKQFNINLNHIKKGLINVKWPGRLQLINQKITKKLISEDDVEIYLDGAHNESGAEALARWIKDNVKNDTYLIFAMTRGRDIESFLKYFSDLFKSGIVTGVKLEPSAYESSILEEMAERALNIEFLHTDFVESAVKILDKKITKPSTIIITGSLFLIGDFLDLMNNL